MTAWEAYAMGSVLGTMFAALVVAGYFLLAYFQ